MPTAAPPQSSTEPGELTAAMIRDVSGSLPAGFLTFLSEILALGSAGKDAAQIARDCKPALDILKKKTDGIEALIRLYRVYRLIKSGSSGAFGEALTAVGILWSFLPSDRTACMVSVLDRMTGRVEKLRPLQGIWADLERVGGTSAMLKLLGALILEQPGDARSAASELMGSMKSTTGGKIALRLAGFFLNLLPARVKGKLAAKAVGRKIPIVGTIVVGIFDVGAIFSNPKDWKNWAGLGSTAAGLIPGVGTAASAATDLAILIGTIIDTGSELSKLRPAGNPFAA